MSVLGRLRTWPWPVHVAGACALVAGFLAAGFGARRDFDFNLARGSRAAITAWVEFGFPVGGDRFVIVDSRLAQTIADDSRLSAPPGVDLDSFALQVTPRRISFSRGDRRYGAPGVRVVTTAWMRIAPNAALDRVSLRLQLPPSLNGQLHTVYNRSADMQPAYGDGVRADSSRSLTAAELTVHRSRAAAWLTVVGNAALRFVVGTLLGSLGAIVVLWTLSSMGIPVVNLGLEDDPRASLPRIPRRA